MITITEITTQTDLDAAFAIRREVFVEEQNVPADEEYDEFEATSRHFLARLHGKPVGTARWRETDKGVKLERFAVRHVARGQGVGQALVQALLDDVALRAPGRYVYLHAQVSAVPLYLKFGFQTTGPQFDECGIWHYKMERLFHQQPN